MGEQLQMSFDASDDLAGFRLERLEIYNWGTFNGRVWTVSPRGRNSLLTGDIGSGKSTIVDAVTTLLVPANRIMYNKAAGAENKERSLRSYVHGFYRLERNESGSGAKPVALRGDNSYSVLLGVFTNTGYQQCVTLAQIFWQKEHLGQPERFYVVADCELSIVEHLSNFGSDIRDLRKRLKASTLPLEIYDSFPLYGAAFRRRFGIQNEQALELFHQTVSMKSVGNLTDFVRMHMLEIFDAATRIEALVAHFDDLNRAHDAVRRAKRQISLLRPMCDEIGLHEGIEKAAALLRSYREALKCYFAFKKHELIAKRLQKLEAENGTISNAIERLKRAHLSQLAERDRIRQAIAENGGDRIAKLQNEIDELFPVKKERMSRHEQYDLLVKELQMIPAISGETFEENRQGIAPHLVASAELEAELQNLRTDEEVGLVSLKQEHERISSELESLRLRRSNIETRQILIRRDLCREIGCSEEDLPFAGELIRVRPGEERWEGAAERILRNFALSLLVPERLYTKVSEWVDRTDLRGKLVYYRVAEAAVQDEAGAGDTASLVYKLEIKDDSPFAPWLSREISRRFDYVCCETMESFRRERQALTLSGQVKGSGNRHEKDDRGALQDRSRYVLGWSNEAKIALLEAGLGEHEKLMQQRAANISDLQSRQKSASRMRDNLVKLEVFDTYDTIDWRTVALKIARLEDDKAELEKSSDVLASLSKSLEQVEADAAETERSLDAKKDEKSRNGERREQLAVQLAVCAGVMNSPAYAEHETSFADIDALRDEHFQTKGTFTVEMVDTQHSAVRDWYQDRIDAEEKRLKRAEERIIAKMQDYRRDYPAETAEVDATMASSDEYRKMLAKLEADDLPKFEGRFKQLLNENAIREIANFQSQLYRERQLIRERIARINNSLSQIEYNRGRYILLEDQANTDREILDFQLDLKSCTEYSLSPSDDGQYAEEKFQKVREIINRFSGNTEFPEASKRWTQKVTDVRNWFIFAASERWIEDNTEYEHYTDSGGKSGGQKEKLAYTVLAASLAYQFGLEWGEIRSRSFRFVVIDEAFGRGSDESTRFGLELFRKLNLQLLIVTPLQKIHIIEPYVSSVGYVHNSEGSESQIRNLTIEEYFAEKRETRGEE